MAKEKKSTEVATISVSASSSATQFVNRIQQEYDALKASSEKGFKVSDLSSLGAGFGDLKTMTEIPQLIRAYSAVAQKEDSYVKSAEELGLTTYPAFNVGGGNKGDWKEAIQQRISVITHDARLKELTELMKEAKEFMTVEDKKEMFFAKFNKVIGEQGAIS